MGVCGSSTGEWAAPSAGRVGDATPAPRGTGAAARARARFPYGTRFPYRTRSPTAHAVPPSRVVCRSPMPRTACPARAADVPCRTRVAERGRPTAGAW
ncbi:hypothetical protein GCM10018793_25010 [Streptomyces sulfonofaciens]|uniref:Uncharacterized protein n=1 Tax=Streptomyces sulfonofaciens TaxID=68272 RepID=A0A919G449_9ACTN|nr:hypothetical protein GCM10018793_25010 [Streptomyces sulfonofaciens]